MTLIDRHGPCVGIRLWQGRKHFVQMWYCPRDYRIEQHSHPSEDIELMYVFGKTTFYRVVEGSRESFSPTWRDAFKRFTVAAGVVHWFTVSSWPLIFINFAKFKHGNACSAAVDFQAIKKD